MSSYDLADALGYLAETETSPKDLLFEVEDAMSDLDPSTPLWHTLLHVADFLERIG